MYWTAAESESGTEQPSAKKSALVLWAKLQEPSGRTDATTALTGRIEVTPAMINVEIRGEAWIKDGPDAPVVLFDHYTLDWNINPNGATWSPAGFALGAEANFEKHYGAGTYPVLGVWNFGSLPRGRSYWVRLRVFTNDPLNPFPTENYAAIREVYLQ
jgi:hypothetical protein